MSLQGNRTRNCLSTNVQKILVENLKGRDHSEDQDVDGKIILEWMLLK